MSDLNVPRVHDLNVPHAKLLIARAENSIDEQEIVLLKKDLRLAEIDEEEVRVKAEQAAQNEKADGLDKRAKASSGLTATRLTIEAREAHLVANRYNERLLELDDDRRQVRVDQEASRTAIAGLQAEVSQQKARLKDEQEAPSG